MKAMRKSIETEIKVGLFVGLGTTLTMIAILVLGGQENFFTRTNHYVGHFPSVEGLIPGAKIVIGGIQVGTVDKVDYDAKIGNIRVDLDVVVKYAELVRQDSTVEILTQGVLGDKYVSISAGSPTKPRLEFGGEIIPKPYQDLTQFLNKGDQLIISLNSVARSLDTMLKSFESEKRSEIFFQGIAATARNLAQASQRLNAELDQIQLKSAVGHLDGILRKIDRGTGTLGALVNDPGLYYDAKALLGGANRNRIIRNLVRKTIKDSEEAQEDVPPAKP